VTQLTVLHRRVNKILRHLNRKKFRTTKASNSLCLFRVRSAHGCQIDEAITGQSLDPALIRLGPEFKKPLQRSGFW
jgi:hypothetical protein